MSSQQPDTIVLIHGLWLSPLSWEHWAARFEGRGFKVLAPAWPGMEGDIEQLRADTSGIDELGIAEILDSYEAKIRELDAAADHHGPLLRRGLHRGAARPRSRCGRRGDRRGGRAGHHEAAVLDAQVGLPDPEEPGQQTPRGRR